MKGDFSRVTFDPEKRYSGVRMQQGRVQVDADWNEQLDIATYLRETMVADVVGPSGVPDTDELRDSFEVTPTVAGDDLEIAPGRAYVAGILVENEATVAITGQPHLPGFTLPAADPAGDTGYVAYLDVWRRHVTALEDGDLLELALGGPDTATRQQTVWQVKLQELPAGSPLECDSFTPPRGAPRPRLRARSASQAQQNQLYRVEVHRGGLLNDPDPDQRPTFKWSRDNGAVAASIEAVTTTEVRIAAEIQQDLAGGFEAGQWIEVTDRERLLSGQPGTFARLATVEGQVLTVEGWPDPGDPAPVLGEGAVLRRWDSDQDPAVEVPATNDGYLPLEDGVEIQFDDSDSTIEYLGGDYWWIASRSAAAQVLWPVDGLGEPLFQEPRGVRHDFTPLAVLSLTSGGLWQLVGDCRQLFQPTTIIPGPEKVSVSGDTMTGTLTIEADLEVGGTVRVDPAFADPPGTMGFLELTDSLLVPALGSDLGLEFPPLDTGVGDAGFLRRFTSAGKRRLALGVTGGAADILTLEQGGQPRLTLANGRVGVGTTDPQADLHVTVREALLAPTDRLRIDGPLYVKGTQSPQEGQVLTAADGDGQVVWRELPERQIGVPTFLSRKAVVFSGSGATGWVTYPIDPAKVPADASAVILEAFGAQSGPDSGDKETHLQIRSGPDEVELLLIAGRASGSGDSVAWGGQGIFPISGGGGQASFQFRIESPGFGNGCQIYLVGYFPG